MSYNNNQSDMYQASDGKWYPRQAMPQGWQGQHQSQQYGGPGFGQGGYGQQPYGQQQQYGYGGQPQYVVQGGRRPGAGPGVGAAVGGGLLAGLCAGCLFC